MSRTVVITGFGAFTPLGTDAPSTWEAMLAGRSGVRTLEQEWAAELPVTFAAQVAGDPLDVLVLLDYPVFPGVGVKVRPVGVLKMSDEAGGDDKVIAVQHKDPRWSHIQDVADIPEYTRKEIEHFFEHYKDLEPGKWVKVDAWGSAADAEQLIIEAQERLAAQGH